MTHCIYFPEELTKVISMAGNFLIDHSNRTVVYNGRRIRLSPKECSLLEYFLKNKNSVIKRKKLLEIIWKYAPDIDSRVVDVYVGYLRKKIENSSPKKIIHSVRGMGYMFKD